MQRDFAFPIPLGAGDLRPAQPTGAAKLDSEGSLLHGQLHSAFHRPAKRDTALELRGHVFGDQLSFDIGCLYLDDINLNLLTAGIFSISEPLRPMTTPGRAV